MVEHVTKCNPNPPGFGPDLDGGSKLPGMGHQLPGGHTPDGIPRGKTGPLVLMPLRFLSRIDIHKKKYPLAHLLNWPEKSIRRPFLPEEKKVIFPTAFMRPLVFVPRQRCKTKEPGEVLYAVTLGAVVDMDMIRRIVHNCEEIRAGCVFEACPDRPVTLSHRRSSIRRAPAMIRTTSPGPVYTGNGYTWP